MEQVKDSTHDEHFHDELSACRLLRRYAHDCMNVPAVFEDENVGHPGVNE